MITLRERIYELDMHRCVINIKNLNIEDFIQIQYTDKIKIINEEYFDGKLKMDVEIYGGDLLYNDDWKTFDKFIINDNKVEMGEKTIEYLERLETLYNLENIKNKIDKINDED